MPETNASLPSAAVLVRHRVADFDTWKAGFDDHEGARRAAGMLGHHLNRAEDDPNDVSIYLALSDVYKAKDFAASDDLRTTMEELGVVSEPEFTWMTPAREAIVWDHELPAFILSHRVYDFDSWLEGYDEAEGLRDERGIIGQAANRSLDNPSVAVVYHQAESFDALRDFLADGELKVVMKEAGVISEPVVSFVTGGSAKLYD